MLVSYVTNHEKYLAQLHQTSQSPFISFGFYQETKKQLIEQFWLSHKTNKKQDYEYKVSTLLDLIKQGHDKGMLTQACLQLLPKHSESFKTEILNTLYYSDDGQAFAKNLIMESDSSLLLKGVVNDPELIGLRLLNGDKNIALNKNVKYALSWLLTPIDYETPNSDILDIYQIMLNVNLLESALMSLFLWLLSPVQINALLNYASKNNSDEEILLLLAKSGLVKHTLLINSALLTSANPKILIAQIRRNLSLELDQLIPYEIQIKAWEGDNDALIEFQSQLQKNWFKFQHDLSFTRLIAGMPLSPNLNTLQCVALDKQSLFLYQLYLKYHSLTFKKDSVE